MSYVAIRLPLLAMLGALMFFAAAVALTLLARIRTDLRGLHCELVRAREARREGAR